jgi:hypothetical protein
MANTSTYDDTGLSAMVIIVAIVVPVTIILLTTCCCCYFWRMRNTKRRKAELLRTRGPQPPAYSRTPPIKLPVYLPKKPEQARNGECV